MQLGAISLGAVLVITGVALPLLAWTFFRKRAYRFWTFAPFATAHEYMEPIGGVLWWTGIAILLVGILTCWATR